MSWKKVLVKFFVGCLTGGVATLSATQDLEKSGLTALVVGVLTAGLNYLKHRTDVKYT